MIESSLYLFEYCPAVVTTEIFCLNKFFQEVSYHTIYPFYMVIHVTFIPIFMIKPSLYLFEYCHHLNILFFKFSTRGILLHN